MKLGRPPIPPLVRRGRELQERLAQTLVLSTRERDFLHQSRGA